MHRIDLRPYAGQIIIATAFLHVLVGIAAFPGPLQNIINDGVFDAVGERDDRNAALWFLYNGALMFWLGITVRWSQAQTGSLPPALGWSMLWLSLLGTVLVPASGFWIMILIALLLIAVARSPQPA
ncbi:MAG: DUF6463 family protein [Anaerolineae bacterium]|nr:DUF6463 family protein [Anaerolineae bacterium]